MPSFYVGSNFYVKEIKGKYYVYITDNESDSKQRHHYVDPLEKVIETCMAKVRHCRRTSVAGPGNSLHQNPHTL